MSAHDILTLLEWEFRDDGACQIGSGSIVGMPGGAMKELAFMYPSSSRRRMQCKSLLQHLAWARPPVPPIIPTQGENLRENIQRSQKWDEAGRSQKGLALSSVAQRTEITDGCDVASEADLDSMLEMVAAKGA